MIDVQFDFDKENKSISLKVKGHAGQANPGRDIVCAAASILDFTVAQMVKDIYKRKGLRKKPVLNMRNGDSAILCKPKEDCMDETLHVFFVAQTGYQLLSHNYPQFVKVSVFGKA